MRVYYAHHQWKQGTDIVSYEQAEIDKEIRSLKLIDEYAQEEITLVDPISKGSPRPNLGVLEDCNLLVFSSVSGMLDRDTYEDVICAFNSGKSVYYFDKGKLCQVSQLSTFQNKLKDMVYVGNPDIYVIFDYEKGR